MPITLALSTLIGVALGLLGGGGSILAVPILMYGLGLQTKSAIATSLLVVGVTSLAALGSYARKGLVEYRTGLFFGGSGMLGAFLGAKLAVGLPSTLLLVAFAGMMLVTAIAMLRGREDVPSEVVSGATSDLPVGKVLLHGLVVGAVTGLVGAGGGFLIVPALVLLGRLPMQKAVATSLLVISMKSFAGFAGYAGQVPIDWKLTGLIAALAVVGSIAGSRLSGKIPQQALRQLFGWFVIVMAVFVLSQQLPGSVTGSATFRSVFVERWPWWVGGVAIGGFVLFMLWFDNKQLGVSTGCSELCAAGRNPALRSSWRIRFLAGIVLGGAVSGLLAGRHPSFAAGAFDQLFGSSLLVKLPLLLGAGVLVGYGARLAGGCTSGHGIVGTALGAKSSWLATGLFMLSGFVTTNALVFILRG